jgi:hypothetical protein
MDPGEADLRGGGERLFQQRGCTGVITASAGNSGQAVQPQRHPPSVSRATSLPGDEQRILQERLCPLIVALRKNGHPEDSARW